MKMDTKKIHTKKFQEDILKKAKELGFKKGVVYERDGVEYEIKGDLYINTINKYGTIPHPIKKNQDFFMIDCVVINHKNSSGYIYDSKTNRFAKIVKNKKACMGSAYYIMILRQVGNIGAKEIFKIDDQPKEGFNNEPEAEKHLEKLFNEGKYPYDNKWKYSFMISKLYSNIS